MARKRSADSSTIDPQVWLAQILRQRFEAIVECYSAPLEKPKDEGVHDMRVAIRRLRSALRDFGRLTDKFPLKKIRKQLRSLADTLGEVRDLDVAIEAFTDAAGYAESTSVKKGIEEIVRDCQRQRSDAYNRLEKHLTKEDLAELTKQFDHAFDQTLRQHKMFDATSVEEAGRVVIESALDRFLENIDAIYEPFAVRRIHRLRIAGKHLRYAIELFEGLWDGRLRSFGEQTKKMQSYLGDLHDRDFWIAGSGKRISAERPRNKKQIAVYQARVWLLSEFTKQRMSSYRNALATWNDWKNDDLPGKLRKVIAGRPKTSGK